MLHDLCLIVARFKITDVELDLSILIGQRRRRRKKKIKNKLFRRLTSGKILLCLNFKQIVLSKSCRCSSVTQFKIVAFVLTTLYQFLPSFLSGEQREKMDQLEPTDIAFGAGDIDGLAFPPTDEHIATTVGHELQQETHPRHGQSEILFTSAQLDMPDYDNSLTHNIGMSQIDSVINADIRVLAMDNLHQGRPADSDHIVRPRHSFPGEGTGPRAYTMNQLHGFQQIQQTQPTGSPSLSNSTQQVYPVRHEQPYPVPTSFDVNSFLNTRQQQVSPGCAVSQYISNSYQDAHNPQTQPQPHTVQQQTVHGAQPNASIPGSAVHNRLPSAPGISAMLSGIKPENDYSRTCARRQMQQQPFIPLSPNETDSNVNHNRMAADLFGIVTEACLRLPPVTQDGLPGDVVPQTLSIEQNMATSNPVSSTSTLMPIQQNDRVTSEAVYPQNGPKADDIDQISRHLNEDVRDADDVSSASDEDDANEKDEDYVPHLENVTYKHKKLTKARQHNSREQLTNQKTSNKTDAQDVSQHAQVQGNSPSGDQTLKKNPIEGITLDVGPDGATRVKVSFIPGQTLAEDLVAAFKNVLQKQLKHEQESAEAGNSPASVEQPSILELSFKLKTPEKTRASAATVKEYDKPKRSWKERAHNEQGEQVDPSKVQTDTVEQPSQKEANEEDSAADETLPSDKPENEDSQGKFVWLCGCSSQKSIRGTRKHFCREFDPFS